MEKHEKLLLENKAWAREKTESDPDFFMRMAKEQTPDFLWIGCSDSRVPANEITNSEPGEMFVHRNIANLVIHTDLNLMSVIQFAVEELKVKHIIVCGHYGCGGVKAALSKRHFGLINNWLREIKDVYSNHRQEIDGIESKEEQTNRLVELNIIHQVMNLTKTAVIQNSWKKNNAPILHGWVYDMKDGILHSLTDVLPNMALDPVYQLDIEG